MHKPLAFKSPTRTEEFITVGDEHTGFIEDVRKLGSLTPNEAIAWDVWVERCQSGDLKDSTWTEQQLHLIANFLRLRQDPQMTVDILKESIQDFDLINRLFQFYRDERYRHVPSTQLLRVEGEGAKEVAIAYAKEKKAVVATRADLVNQNIYFVMKSLADVGELDAIEDFSDIETAEIAVGKRGRKNSTGTPSTTE